MARAHVVDEAGQESLFGPRAAAHLAGCFHHQHERPARARVIAAASPFGPAPTTTAS